MPTYRTNVGADGVITLPAALRRKLHIQEGSAVEFFLTLDGQVHFHAITKTAAGMRNPFGERRNPPVSIREMDDAIGEYVVKDNERILRQAGRKPKTAPGLSSAAE